MGATSNPLGQVRPDLHAKWGGGDGAGAPRQLHRSFAWRPGLAKTMQPPSFHTLGFAPYPIRPPPALSSNHRRRRLARVA